MHFCRLSTLLWIPLALSLPALHADPEILLPVEVLGEEGTTRVVSFTLQEGSTVTAKRLWMQVHKADYENKIAVQINGGTWIVANSKTATIHGLGARYGGFGGGFHTLDITLDASGAAIREGRNEVRFRLNTSNGESLGFRVLKFNFLDSANRGVIPQSKFEEDDPGTWTAPYKASASIAEGKRLWRHASLVTSKSKLPMRAKCADCHAHDGRDLKYFNESNYAIRASAMVHGLTRRQGDLIASYIRSLNMPNPGRPWNPPYQPGPALDSKPVSAWAAGAGLESVLSADAQTVRAIPQDLYRADANLNIRETPIALQLPDWSHWLPRVHPVDAWGEELLASEFHSYYQDLRTRLERDPAAYPGLREEFNQWYVRWTDFMWPKILPERNPNWTSLHTVRVDSAALWKLVKLWEIMQEFGLEDRAREVFGPQADQRAWNNQWPFMVSPNMQHIPRGAPGIGNGSVLTHIYRSYSWYHLQLILNNGNKRQSGNTPIDWPYAYGFVKDMANFSGEPQASLQMLWLTKAGQVSARNKGPEYGVEGWMPNVNDPSRLIHPAWSGIWKGTDEETRARIMETVLRSWFEAIRPFTPQQFYQGGWTEARATPSQNAMDGSMCDRIWYMLPQFQYYGVDRNLIADIAAWASRVWPNGQWNTIPRAQCSQLQTGEVRCVVPAA